ncbi:liprin-beta-1-like isoform X1 [Gadus chalcogrammus]|uniref:liprin-beta-1-like isoform X1 n=1 Tax=Gadus chalcogrammus TaxID=1042646 RepID=UPI0024C3561F|nr:liprin-beta-1-like isoform X1 [Gadus chalcogrammus]
MMSDASEMLAAALEQMDGIIAGSKAMDYSNGLFDCQSPSSPFLGGMRALHLLEDLRAALELMDGEERDNLRCQIPDSTAEGLAEWLHQGRLSNGHGFGSVEAAYQERLSRLESDKECLVLQVSVLTDQVEVQGEKIRDLDRCLAEHREKLNNTEQLFQQELSTRTTLETQRTELMSELSRLKVKLSDLERDRQDAEGLYQEVTELRFRLSREENERQQCERKLNATTEELQLVHGRLGEQEGELWRLKEPAGRPGTGGHDAGRDMEMLNMKSALESLMSANSEKDQRIEELLVASAPYRRGQDLMEERLNEADYDDITDHPSVAVAMETAQVVLAMEAGTGRSSGESSPCIAVLSEMTALDRERQQATESSAPPSSSAAQTPPGAEQSTSQEGSASPTLQNESFGTKKARSSFGRGFFFKSRGAKRTGSSPNLALFRSASLAVAPYETPETEAEQRGTDHLDLAVAPPPPPRGSAPAGPDSASSPETRKKTKGLRKFFGRMKRSHSSSLNLDDPSDSEFRRGGVRATAGPRLGWSHDLKQDGGPADPPFPQWSSDQVCGWLAAQGLGQYVAQGREWILSGQTLLDAPQSDLEKELCIRNPLHRKKLQLALRAAVGPGDEDLQGMLNHNWVTRWLDDIGLPQYKSQFDEARVDGRMLHHMTVEDLLSLKVGSVLHHLSIKRAVQVLRLNRYQPNCLRRRPSDENNITPAEVAQWTNHRVMEWLRSVDLAEYAPNLRGSGVHGGLMVLEPRFNVETLALLLNIPPSKTLLRRHLGTHFTLLTGAEAGRSKQDGLENPDYSLLTATARVKPRRLSFGGFGTLRRKQPEDTSDYVCPIDVEMPKNASFQQGLPSYGQLAQMEDSEGTVRQIGVFSEEINNLTNMLQGDVFMTEVTEVDGAQGDVPV